MFYDYFVSGSVPGTMAEFPIFNLTENLTLKYSEEYPDANISKVEVTSNVQAFIYRAQ